GRNLDALLFGPALPATPFVTIVGPAENRTEGDLIDEPERKIGELEAGALLDGLKIGRASNNEKLIDQFRRKKHSNRFRGDAYDAPEISRERIRSKPYR